ncbi:MAG TPA: O-antigen ligase family protein, partial [Caulobacteraceae bacterium]|nr:O-antigen ligase family protein [Caulobacteraceae bacterium]
RTEGYGKNVRRDIATSRAVNHVARAVYSRPTNRPGLPEGTQWTSGGSSRRTALTIDQPRADSLTPPESSMGLLMRQTLDAFRGGPTLIVAATFGIVAAAFVLIGAYVPVHGDLVSAGRVAALAGAILAGSIAALCVAAPWTGLVAWTIATPLINVARAQVAIGSLQLITTSVLLLALIAGWWLHGRPRPAGWVELAGFSILALAFLAAFASATPVTSLPIALHGLVEPTGLALVVAAWRPTRRQLIALMLAIGFSVTVGSLINLVRLPGVIVTFHDVDIGRQLFARLTYFNIGIFGDVLVMALPMIMVSIGFWRQLRLPRILPMAAVASLVIVTWSLYLTVTKSAWLASLVVVLLFAAGAQATGWRKLGLVAAPFVVGAILILAGPSIGQLTGLAVTTGADSSGGNARISTIDPSTPEGEVSVTERVYATRAALAMAADQPWLGIGPGRFADAYLEYRPKASDRVLTSAHDFLPDVAAEFGLPMAVLLGGVCLIALWLAWRRRQSGDPETRALAMAFGLALVGFLIMGSLFGLDLYRANRQMNSDVLLAALIIASIVGLAPSPQRLAPVDPDAAGMHGRTSTSGTSPAG